MVAMHGTIYVKYNIGEIMKRQTVGNVKSWKEKNLRKNPMIKRRNILRA